MPIALQVAILAIQIAVVLFAARLAADVLSGIIGAWLALRTINALIAKQKK